jgi:hypothetical protein
MPETVTKSWYASKTLWFNIAVGIVAALDALLAQNILPGGAAEIVLMVVNGLNIILRLLTSTAIKGMPSSHD